MNILASQLQKNLVGMRKQPNLLDPFSYLPRIKKQEQTSSFIYSLCLLPTTVWFTSSSYILLTACTTSSLRFTHNLTSSFLRFGPFV